MNTQQMMEEIDRLARLCEAKDEEIVELRNEVSVVQRDVVKYSNQLSEAQAQIAMLSDALKAVKAHDDYAGQYSHLPEAQQTIADSYADALALVCKSISATSETVAAWRTEETEPLRVVLRN